MNPTTRSALTTSGQQPPFPLSGYRPGADNESLRLIILDNLRRANFCFVWIEPDIAKSTALAQEVPALIQLDLNFHEPFPIGPGVSP